MMTSVNGAQDADSGGELRNPAIEDRRLYRRYAIAIDAELEFEGQRRSCAINDLSLGGAAIEPSFPELKGHACRLHCKDFYFDAGIAGRVVNSNATATHIEFLLDEDMEASLTMFLIMSPATR